MKTSFLSKLALVGFALALSGCASTSDPRDPFEPLNRGIYKFNDTLDQALLKPVAKGYNAVLPNPVRTGVSNFFANLDDALIAVNNLLQFKVERAASDVARLIANTTFGIGGLFDVATSFGLEKHNEDFGQTFGYWGIGDGPFLMLPLLGPSNVRDSVGLFAYSKLDPVLNLNHIPTRNTLSAVRALDRRARLLDAEKVLDEAALDPYTFLRDAYIQQRRSLIYDGNPPREKYEDEPAPGKKADADDMNLPTSGNGAQRLEAAAPAAPIAESHATAETPEEGIPALLAWLLRSGDAAGWQE